MFLSCCCFKREAENNFDNFQEILDSLKEDSGDMANETDDFKSIQSVLQTVNPPGYDNIRTCRILPGMDQSGKSEIFSEDEIEKYQLMSRHYSGIDCDLIGDTNILIGNL